MTINRLLIVFFSLLIILLTATMGCLVWLFNTEVEITASSERRFESYKLADELRQGSDDLTTMARLYVSTGDERFAIQFQEILDIRSGEAPRPDNYDRVYWDLVVKDGEQPEASGQAVSLESRMIEEGFTTLEFSKLSESQRLSNDLVRLESIAMNAVRGRFDDGTGKFNRAGEPDFELARQLMFGNDYLRAKAAIMEPINEFLALLDERTSEEVAQLRAQGRLILQIVLALSGMAILLSFASILALRRKVLRPLSLVSEATQLVSDGHYDHQIDHHSSDEVGRLVAAFNAMVDKTRKYVAEMNSANTTLQQNQQDLQEEKKKSEELLLNILPGAIADRLRDGETTIADEFPDVTVMFADLVNFTKLSEDLGPYELVKLLNDIFAIFDRRLEEFGLEKIKTIGDSYMVVAGVPEPAADHARRVCEFAFAIREDFARFVATRGIGVGMRIGAHSGTAIAGVVGTKKFAYDLWGDVVNVASRMESSGEPDEIHVSEAFMVRLKDLYEFEARGNIEIKGKGPMQTFFVSGRRYARQ